MGGFHVGGLAKQFEMQRLSLKLPAGRKVTHLLPLVGKSPFLQDDFCISLNSAGSRFAKAEPYACPCHFRAQI